MSIKKILFITLAIVLVGCKDKKDTALEQRENLYEFRQYISNVTSGVISTQSDVRVVLRNPTAKFQGNQILEDDILKVSPQTQGKVVALNNQSIAFVPENGFKQDTEYSFTLDLKAIIDTIDSDYKNFTFKVKTIKQQFNITTEHLQSYSKDWQYVQGILRSSDVMDLRTAKSLVSASQNGKSLSIKFNEAVKKSTQIPFTIDSIQRLDEDSEIVIQWDGSDHNIQDKGEASVTIPGKSNFTIVDVLTFGGEDQHLEINFSDPLKKDQNIDGLVSLQGANKLSFIIEGNVLKVYPDQKIKGVSDLTVFEGIVNSQGNPLKSILQEKVAFEQLKPQVRLLSSGNILPSSNNLKINFEAVNLRAVDVTVIKIYQDNILQFLQNSDLNQSGSLRNVGRPIAKKAIQLQNNLTNNSGDWKAYALDLREIISPDPGAIYRVEFSFDKKYSAYTCQDNSDNFELNNFEDFKQDMLDSKQWDPTDDSYYYDNYSYDYNWNDREDPCTNSYYYNKEASTNIIASDLALTVKKGKNESYFVAVNHIVSTEPLPGAKITFYNYQQQPIGDITTDQTGTAIFDSPMPAYFAIAENDNQKTYIKLNDGNALSISKFDVSGVELHKGIKGFIYGERGVWRPGDTIHLNFILNDTKSPIPSQHPVVFELSDPYGKVIDKKTNIEGEGGFYNFSTPTNPEATTGNYLAKVKIGGATFSKRIKVETIKPNRLKIKTSFDHEILSSQQPIEGELEVHWLHGAIAKNLKSDINVRFSKTKTSFKDFPNYVFDDPTSSFNSQDLTIFNGSVNAEGKASFSLNPELKGKAPGQLQATFITKVYENGGDFSTDVTSVSYSPYQTFVGLKVPEGDQRNMLVTDQDHNFEVVTVNTAGEPEAVEDLEVSVYKVNWRWWWDTSQENLSTFNSSNYQEKVYSTTISTKSNGKASFNFSIEYPEWGRYLVRVEDKKGMHSTAETVYIDWPGWAGKSKNQDSEAATMLVFSTDKEFYTVGQEAMVTFPSSLGGRALVTIENGNEVLESLWVLTQQGETKFQLPISGEYAPNVYIHISLIQPHAKTENDAPIRMYGVIPIKVTDPETVLHPRIAMPDKLAPEGNFTIEISEENSKAMTYTVAIVDEGLLDLTNFITPNPWNDFFAREALGVKTWDVYDQVVGAFGGRIDQVFSIGGDGMASAASTKKANRFEPMVLFLGPFQLGQGEKNSHKIHVPKYIGSVRTMVIAGNVDQNAYGIAEKTTPVKKPLMVLASAPRKITPKERVTLPVTVFAMESSVKNVTVKLKENPHFEIIGQDTKTVQFDQPDEKMVFFDLQVNQITGIGEIEVLAQAANQKASYEIELDVINPNPVTTQVTPLTLEGNKQADLDFKTFGITGSNTAEIEFSTLPPMDFTNRLQYLIRYPYGCIEQITSAAFPQLYLESIFDLTFDKKKDIQRNVEKTIERLGRFQLVGGGFSYWPGQSYANDWSSSYAGHFLLEAEKLGYVMPIGFKSKWVQYQQQRARAWRSSANGSSLAQAYRLYTLALAGQPDVSSMNRLRETPKISNYAKLRLAAAYALIGQAQVASTIFENANISYDAVNYDHYTYGSKERNMAMGLETLVLLDRKERALELAQSIAKALESDQWMSTQTTAYSLLSMSKFANYIGGKAMKLSYTINGKSESITTEKSLANRALAINEGQQSIRIDNQGDNTVFVRLITSGKLEVGSEKPLSRNLKTSVVYKGRNGEAMDVSRLSQGTNFISEITITNTQGDDINNLALTQLIPSGWEIVNTRFTDFGNFKENDLTHTDLRDDRSNFFFDLKAHQSKTIRLLLNASYLGRYYLPGVQCQAMYDNNYLARTSGMWVEVTQ